MSTSNLVACSPMVCAVVVAAHREQTNNTTKNKPHTHGMKLRTHIRDVHTSFVVAPASFGILQRIVRVHSPTHTHPHILARVLCISGLRNVYSMYAKLAVCEPKVGALRVPPWIWVYYGDVVGWCVNVAGARLTLVQCPQTAALWHMFVVPGRNAGWCVCGTHLHNMSRTDKTIQMV